MKRTILLALTGIFLQQITFAQSPTFQTRYYTTENGLPSNGIKGIEWDDSTGFLWLGTEAGIVRFNGIDFKTFTRENTPFIGSERISFLIRNNKGTTYAVDQTGHILKVEKNKLVLDRVIPFKDGRIDPGVYALMVSERFLNYKIAHPGSRAYPVLFSRNIVLNDTSMLVIDGRKQYFVSMTNPEAADREFNVPEIKNGFKIGENLFLVSGDKIFKADVEIGRASCRERV